ncbi:MAG: PD40 domain-containing protein [Acidobacteriota bacterium]|nr:MAG: PD40 domain-containing protein [Acidobacteriota bacterium]
MKAKFLILLILLGSGFLQAQDPDAVIFPKPTPTRLAVADFTPKTSSTPDTQTALNVFNQVLLDDLKFSAFFELPSKSFYPLKPLRTPQDVIFENWQVPTLDIDFLAFGSVQVDATVTVVEAYVYDVKTRQQVIGKRYTIGDTTLIRRVAHEFADQVVYELSAGASQGVAKSRIAFSSLKGDSKEIWVMDYDGANGRQISFNGGINKFPEWSADNQMLVYVAKLPTVNRWQLFLHEVDGRPTEIEVTSSYVSSPAFARDGRVAFSSRTQSSREADIFIRPAGGGPARNITNARGIDTSPSWSPTGAQIAFISDRTGGPQVWVMDADGSNLRQLVTEGGHCDSPDWSPDGRFVLYSWQAPRQWKHDIYLAEVATGKLFQLTSGFGTNESPHWSPDGRHIAFQSTRTGTKQIFIMNADGRNLKQVTTYGINESPAWAPYVEANRLGQ